MCAQVGATLTMMENRFTPARFKDGYGPVGAWFLLFKAKVQNGLGEFYANSDSVKDELGKIHALRCFSGYPDLSA